MIPALVVALGCLLSPVGPDLSGRGPTVVARYRAPDCAYCAGHRTVDFAVGSGVVRAPVSGRVVFAGEVAGVGYVSIEPFAEPSTVVTVGGVTSPGVDAGAPVPRGARIGVAGVPGPVTLSVRRRVAGGEAEYLDPTPWLGRPPARLVPPGGGGARPPGGGLVCRVVRER